MLGARFASANLRGIWVVKSLTLGDWVAIAAFAGVIVIISFFIR